MDYLFIQTNSVNGRNGEVLCEIGYVLTDANFNTVERESLRFRPLAPLGSLSRAKNPLVFGMDEYAAMPSFHAVYPKLAALLRNKRTLVVSFDAEKTAKLLVNACRRFRLEPIDYEFYDVGKLYESTDRSLDAFKKSVTDREDGRYTCMELAMMAKLLAKQLEQELSMPLGQIVTYYSLPSGESFGGRVILYEEKTNFDPNELEYDGVNTLTGKNKKIVRLFITEELAYQAHKVYCLPRAYIKEHFRESMAILHRMKTLGLGYSGLLGNRVVLVNAVPDAKEEGTYLDYCREKGFADPGYRSISFDAFLGELSLTEDDLRLSDEALEAILSEMNAATWYARYRKKHLRFARIEHALPSQKFECSVDFPVIQYKLRVQSSCESDSVCHGFILFYDYVMDAFFDWHPYRVNRAANSYLTDDFYEAARKISEGRLAEEVEKRYQPLPGYTVDSCEIVETYPYITSYKFFGQWEGDFLHLNFPQTIITDNDFKSASKVKGKIPYLRTKLAISELYSPEMLSVGLGNMSKMRFCYKNKSFPLPQTVNEEYLEGDEVLLPKYYYLYQSGEESAEEGFEYLPSRIGFITDLYGGAPVYLPCLIKRKL